MATTTAAALLAEREGAERARLEGLFKELGLRRHDGGDGQKEDGRGKS